MLVLVTRFAAAVQLLLKIKTPRRALAHSMAIKAFFMKFLSLFFTMANFAAADADAAAAVPLNKHIGEDNWCVVSH